MSRTWKDKRHETLRVKLPSGKVQYLLVERDPIAKVVKILSRATDDTTDARAINHEILGYIQIGCQRNHD